MADIVPMQLPKGFYVSSESHKETETTSFMFHCTMTLGIEATNESISHDDYLKRTLEYGFRSYLKQLEKKIGEHLG